MPRYFFDVHDDGKVQKDEAGTELADDDAVRAEAMRLLPDLAREEVPEDGDRRSFFVMVTDENGYPIYSAAMNFVGQRLRR